MRLYNLYYPLLIAGEHNVDIAWKVVRQKIETTIRRPSELERETEIFSEENYLGKVVAPWYKEVENVSSSYYCSVRWQY